MSSKINPLTRGKKQKALALLQAGRLEEACALLKRVCVTDRRDTEAWYQLGGVYERMGVAHEAENCYRCAVDLEPARPELHFALGNTQLAQRRPVDAAKCYRRALAINANFLEAQGNLGAAFESLGQLEEAAQSYERALALDRTRPESHYNLANILQKLGRYDAAISAFREAVRRRPDFAVAWDGLGVALTTAALAFPYESRRLELLEEAVDAQQHALRLQPCSADTHNNLAVALRHLGRLEEAAESYRHALALDPKHTDAHEGLATIALLLGNFAEGWKHYRYRVSMRSPGAILPPVSLPTNLSGKHILVVRDQGLGDEIFFLRFGAYLKARGVQLMYRPDPRLAAMLTRTDAIDRILAPNETVKVDYACAVGDLPWLHDMREQTDIPPPLVLPPLPAQRDILRARLASLGNPPYVGVTWRAGDKTKAKVLYKESPLCGLARALQQIQGTVIVLQRHSQPGEFEAFHEALGRPAHDLSALNDDLESMLALLALLDEYVGVSNTNMHLRAGVGKTARVLVPAPPEWRWMTEGRESPWFPGFTVYRQGYDGSWEGAFAMLSADLQRTYGR